jgi:hypothetical protein
LIFGIIAIKKHNKAVKEGGEGPGKGMAIAGVVLSLISLITTTIVVLVIMAAVGAVAHTVSKITEPQINTANAAPSSTTDYHGYANTFENADKLPTNDADLNQLVSYMGEYEKHLYDWYEASTELQYERMVDEAKKQCEDKLDAACDTFFKNDRTLNYQGKLQSDAKESRYSIELSSKSKTYEILFTYIGSTLNKTRIILTVHALTNTNEGMNLIETLKKGDTVSYSATLIGFDKAAAKKNYDNQSSYLALAPRWVYADKITPLIKAVTLSKQQVIEARKQFGGDQWAGEMVGVAERGVVNGVSTCPMMRSNFSERPSTDVRHKRPESTTMYLNITAKLLTVKKL